MPTAELSLAEAWVQRARDDVILSGIMRTLASRAFGPARHRNCAAEILHAASVATIFEECDAARDR